MFTLINSKVEPLTKELAERFRNLEASPTEREINPLRIKMLRDKADAGRLITFQWATAKLGTKVLRMNGQHSSNMLCELNGKFPEGLRVHLDEYEVKDKRDLALLFRQFDDRKSGRSTSDVAGAYQGLVEPLNDVPRPSAKLGVEGIAWFRRHVEGVPVGSGDDMYDIFNETGSHSFLRWLGELFSIKTPEMKRTQIVSAIYATFIANETEAKEFWEDVAKGGKNDKDDNEPSTVLDTWLKKLKEGSSNKKTAEGKEKAPKPDLKPGEYYQGCIYAWNKYRKGDHITSIKYDVDKGLHHVAE